MAGICRKLLTTALLLPTSCYCYWVCDCVCDWVCVCVCECIRWSISSKKQPASHTAHCVCLAAIAATTSCLLGKHTATRACKFLNRWIVFYFHFFRFCCLTTFIIYFLCFHFSLAFLVALWVLRFTIWHFCLAIPAPWSLMPLAVCVCVWDWLDIRAECHVRCVEMCSSTDRHEIFINLLFIAFDSMFVMFQQRLLPATRQVAIVVAVAVAV